MAGHLQQVALGLLAMLATPTQILRSRPLRSRIERERTGKRVR